MTAATTIMIQRPSSRGSDPASLYNNIYAQPGGRAMFSEQLLDHFQNPRNVGELPPPAITIEASNPACGDILRLSARLDDGRIVEVRYRTRGCTASIAAGSALTELICGMSLGSLPELRSGDIEQAVGGLTPETRHAAVLAIDAVRALLKAAAR